MILNIQIIPLRGFAHATPSLCIASTKITIPGCKAFFASA